MTDEEKVAITERAEEAGMSRSGYLRTLGLNTPIDSVVDLKAVAHLDKINGDSGRVAGLGASSVEIERMMVEFRELHAGIRKK